MKRNKMTDDASIISITHIAIVFLLGFFGNLTTIIVIAKYRELQSTTHYYILNLAISDFLMCISTTASRLFFIFDNNFLICKFTTFTSNFFFCSSLFAIFFIAYDRYIFICNPLYYRMHSVSTRNKLLISTAWMVAFMLGIIPYTNVPHIGFVQSIAHGHNCSYRHVLSAYYVMFLVISTELLPPIVLCIMYSRIFVVAKKHAIEIAVQFRNTKCFSMDWHEQRRFTEALMSPFKNPASLLERPKSVAENDQAKQIREVLFNNYNTWKQQRQEELKRISELHLNEDTEVFDAPTQDENLSQVGKSLRKWKRKANSSSLEPVLMNWVPEDRDVIEAESRKNRLKNNKVVPFQNDEMTNTERSRRKTEPAEVQRKRPGVRKYLSLVRFSSFIPNSASRERNHSEGDSMHRDQGTEGSNRGVRANSSIQNTARSRVRLLESLSKVVFWKRKDGSGQYETKKEFKAVRMIGLVVGMFVLLHIPRAIIDIIEVTTKNIQLPSWILNLALCLTYSSPAVNPMIYVIIKRQFRNAFIKFWFCGRIKRRLSECQ